MGKHRYGIVFDAGSSGTRLHVYRWKDVAAARKKADATDLARLPDVKTEKKWTKKVKPGISTFATDPHRVGPDHLKGLFDHALTIVPKEDVENTPVFLLATAGVRLLDDAPRKALLAEVCAYAQQHTRFQLPDCALHIQAISGETEGLYGWLSANYLLDAFNKPQDHAHGKGHSTYGFLDLGGASAQIAFAPNATESQKHGEDLNLLRLRTLDGKAQEYKVFVTTYLGYGVNEARRRYLEDLHDHHAGERGLPDPCLPKGMSKDSDIRGAPYKLVGTGKFNECISRTYPLLEKDAQCDDPPCLFHGVHVPAIDFEVNHFVGVSEYWHTTHEIFEMGHGDNAYNFQTYQQLVLDFCSQDWDTIEAGVTAHKWGKKVDEQTVADVCFKASWLLNLLHDGIGIPRLPPEEDPTASSAAAKQIAKHGYLAPFQAVDKIDDVEVSWTLGKMVLYAASQVPPASHEDLAVGFGSNAPGGGVPADFNYAGGRPEAAYTPSDNPLSESEGSSTDIDTDTDDDSWTSPLDALSHRTPGILLITALLLIILILLLGRDRRASLFRKLNPFSAPSSRRSRRRGSPFQNLAAKLPFGIGARLASDKTRYARLEDGEPDAELGDPASFELAGMSATSSSNSSEDGADARAGGRKRLAASGGTSRTASPRHSHNASAVWSPSGTSSLGLRGTGAGGYFANYMPEGLGLQGVRTESRERGDGVGVGTGHRSRGQSPSSRLRSPMFTPYKESVD